MRAAEAVKPSGLPTNKGKVIAEVQSKDTECFHNDKRRPSRAPGPLFGSGTPGAGGVSTCIFTWESISLLLRWLFSSEKICESFLKVDNRSLGVGGGQERCQGSAAGEAGAAPGRTSCPGAPPPPLTG